MSIFKDRALLGANILNKGSLKQITEFQSKIHEGRGFQTRRGSATLAVSGTLLLQMDIPASLDVEMAVMEMFTNQAQARFELIEAPTLTTGAAAVVPLNLNRQSDKLSKIICFSDPTVISAGTALEDFYFATGNNNFLGKLPDLKWMLKANTRYLVRYTNSSAAIAVAFFRLAWSEMLLSEY